MRLVVWLNRDGAVGGRLTRIHPNTLDYETKDGELDVLNDKGITIATYGWGQWERVERELEEGEEWPAYLLPGHDDEDESGSGEIDMGRISISIKEPRHPDGSE